MSDEPMSFLAKIAAKSIANTRKGTAANAVLGGAILLASYWATDAVESDFPIGMLAANFQWIVYYVVISLVAMAYLVARQSFTTPEVKHPKCPYCGWPMTTTRLKCENCSSKSDKGE